MLLNETQPTAQPRLAHPPRSLRIRLPVASPRPIVKAVAVIRHFVGPGFCLLGNIDLFIPVNFSPRPLIFHHFRVMLKKVVHEIRMFGNVGAIDFPVRIMRATSPK